MKNSTLLSKTFKSNKKVLFFPSCGSAYIRPQLFDLDYDLFIFSDLIVRDKTKDSISGFHDHRRKNYEFDELYEYHRGPSNYSRRPYFKLFIDKVFSKENIDYDDMDRLYSLERTDDYIIFSYKRKFGILFFWDNNLTLAFLKKMKKEVHAFIGVNDGCVAKPDGIYEKGDNYECLNNEAWLAQIAKLAPKEGFLHITDHFPGGREIKYDEYGFKVEEIGYTKWAKDNDVRHNPFPALLCSDERMYIHRVQGASLNNENERNYELF